MARQTPKVVDMTLGIERGGLPVSIAVGSADWFRWLERASVFAYCDDGATITARKQQQRNYRYWYAYAKQSGKLQCVYLGKSEDITASRLDYAMDRLRPVTVNGPLNIAAERYGQRSTRAATIDAQIAALLARSPLTEAYQIDLAKASQRLHDLQDELSGGQLSPSRASQELLILVRALAFALQDERDMYARALATLQDVFRAAHERMARLEGKVRGEVL
jgi:hypothetical protein